MYPTSHNFGYSDSVASTLGIDAAKEEENVLNLTQMMGELDPEIARRILRRHGGDMQKAATSILEGDRGGDESWPSELPPLTYDDGSLTVGPRTPPRMCTSVLSTLMLLSIFTFSLKAGAGHGRHRSDG